MSLTSEQISFRDARLIENLRFKYKQISNYTDDQIVKAYNEWFLCESSGNPDEDGFLEYLEQNIGVDMSRKDKIAEVEPVYSEDTAYKIVARKMVLTKEVIQEPTRLIQRKIKNYYERPFQFKASTRTCSSMLSNIKFGWQDGHLLSVATNILVKFEPTQGFTIILLDKEFDKIFNDIDNNEAKIRIDRLLSEGWELSHRVDSDKVINKKIAKSNFRKNTVDSDDDDDDDNDD